jgi:hypothetical protein
VLAAVPEPPHAPANVAKATIAKAAIAGRVTVLAVSNLR